MKKNYNQPEFVVVEMMPQTIICSSGGASKSIVVDPDPKSNIEGD